MVETLNGSYSGCCSCGVDRRDVVPCDHMAATVMSSRILILTRINIMPYWWTHTTWKLQFPLEEEPVCNVNIAQIMTSKNRNNFIRYCPSWSAPNKAGQPKKDERRKSGVEITMAKKRGQYKRPRKLRLCCQICGKHNPVSEDCWKDPINADKRADNWKNNEDLIAEIGIGADDNVVVRSDDGSVGGA